MQSYPLQGRLGDGHFLLLPSHWALGRKLQQVLKYQWRTTLLSIVLWILWTQVPFAFRGRCFRGPSLCGSLKNWGASPIVYFSGRSWELGALSWLYGAMLGVRFMVKVCLSLFYLFDVSIFSFIQYIDVAQLVSGLHLEGIVPWLAVISVHPWEKRSSGTFCVAILFCWVTWTVLF